MGTFKEVTDTLLKYGEIIVHRTEEYSRIAKLNIDIRRLYGSIERIEKELGSMLIDRIKNGETTFSSQDAFIKERNDKINGIYQDIEAKKTQIDEIKAARNADQGQ